MELLWVELAGERCGLSADAVRELATLGQITPIPLAPPVVCGVIQLRGRVLPVLDLARTPGSRPVRAGSPLVVVELDARASAALLVDRVLEVGEDEEEGGRMIDLAATAVEVKRLVAAAMTGDGGGASGR